MTQQQTGDLVGGRYRLMEPMGQSGLWRANDDERRGTWQVAVQPLSLPPNLRPEDRAGLIGRAEHEIRAVQALGHADIVKTDLVVDEQGRPWSVRQIESGRRLEQITSDGRPKPERVAQIGARVAEVLAVAHKTGIVHGNVHPANVLVDGERVRVLGFGFSALDHTRTPFTSPEQFHGHEPTPASDMWALGATLFFLAEGHLPTPGNPVITRAGLLQSILSDLMSPDPSRRPTAARAATVLLRKSKAKSRRDALIFFGMLGAAAGYLAWDYVPWGAVLPSGGDGPPVPKTPVGKVLSGHEGVVSEVAFSPDGGTLVSAGGDRTLRLWSVREMTETGVLTGHTAPVRAGAFSPDGRTIASGDDANLIRFWNAADRSQLGDPLTGHTGPVSAVAFSPDGKTLASSSDDGAIRLWNVADRTPLGRPITGHTGTVFSVAFSPDGKTLASSGEDRTVRLWDVADRTPLGKPLTGHADSVRTVAFSPNGKTLASGSGDQTVRLWNPAGGTPLSAPLATPGDRVEAVAFSPDSNMLAAGAHRAIRLWDMTRRIEMGPALPGHSDMITSIAVARNGTTLATAGADGTVRVWDL